MIETGLQEKGSRAVSGRCGKRRDRDMLNEAERLFPEVRLRSCRVPARVALSVVCAVVCGTGAMAMPPQRGQAQAQQGAAEQPVQVTGGVQGGAASGVLTPAQTGVQAGATPGGLIPLTGQGPKLLSPLVAPTISPGEMTLLELEGRFSEAVAAGGGKVFAEWFAEDGVTLSNGQPAVRGRGNIAAEATWAAADYQLTWVAQGAQMGPSNDMGFTWGTYQGRSKDKNGEVQVKTGRYMTVWKKQKDGTWKVAMDASANDAAEAGSCCTLPKP